MRIPGFTLTEGVHPGGSALPWHSHDGPTICYVLRGSFVEVSGGERLTCTPGTLKVMPAGERHCDEFDRGDARGLLIEGDASSGRSPHALAKVLDEHVALRGGLPGVIARRLYQEFRAGDDAAPLAVQGLLLELLAATARESGPAASAADPPWLADARDFIHAAPAAPHSLSRLAELVGVHPGTLARSFRLRFGCSVGDYVRRVRIEHAAEQLGGSDLPLAAIALGAGFSDQSHFSNVFRRLTGMAPSAYRRAVRAGRAKPGASAPAERQSEGPDAAGRPPAPS
jgi:AraC family transcriptional regulator